ncbi:MAG TPA: LysR substrate-binding domain-containing protein [Streptosporangiaceae bacterium]|jgi:DNA-binding transcriptional LysR family regulator|nr:LysR substrate-binding domain-containing protein [Streptosporangiaceae bacterium]
MNIELRHLRYFVAVAEDASFSAAARRVHVAQQVLSTQIRQLESAVGTDLLRRTSRGVVLTPAGTAFLLYARETLASVERGVSAALNAARAVSGRLCVGMTVAASGSMRSRLLGAFGTAYPSVELSLLTFDLASPAAGLLDHSSDVALVRPPVDAPGLSLLEVEEEPRVFVLPAGHPLAGRDVLELADVAGLPWVACCPAADGCAPLRWRDDWLVNPRPGGDVPVIGAVARTIDEWREHVVAGRGISLCPASAEVYHARPGLVFVASKGVPLTSLSVAWRSGDSRAVVRSFVELAAGVARDGAAGAEA